MLLYGHLHKGLTYDLMQSPAVSGAQSYLELCYSPVTTQPSTTKSSTPHAHSSESKSQQHRMQTSSKCNNPGHFPMNCYQGERERGSSGKTKKMTSSTKPKTTSQPLEPRDFLHSLSDEDIPALAKTVSVKDHGIRWYRVFQPIV